MVTERFSRIETWFDFEKLLHHSQVSKMCVQLEEMVGFLEAQRSDVILVRMHLST